MQDVPRVATETAFPDALIQHVPNLAHLHAGTDATTTAVVPDVLGTVTQAVLPVVFRTAKVESLSPRPARADAARTVQELVDQAATIPAAEDAAADAQETAAVTASVVAVLPASADARHTASLVVRTHAQVGAAILTG